MLCGSAVCNLATHHEDTGSALFRNICLFPSIRSASQLLYLKNSSCDLGAILWPFIIDEIGSHLTSKRWLFMKKSKAGFYWSQVFMKTRILIKMPLNALLLMCMGTSIHINGWNWRLSKLTKNLIPFSGSGKQLYLWIWFFKSLLESPSLYRTQPYHRTSQTWRCSIWCFCWGWALCHSSSKEKLHCICQWSQSWIL